MKFKEIDGCPVPEAIYDELLEIKRRVPGLVYNSVYRGSDPKAAGILRRFRKSTQAFLWSGWIRRLPGFNPANPPGFSTHELFNDGVAYPVPRGMPLRDYQVGIDTNKPQEFIREAKKLGFTAALTYPGNPREGHHVNFRKEPLFRPFKTLRRGMKSVRVRGIRKNLAYVRDPDTDRPYLSSPRRARGSQFYFDEALEDALTSYQYDRKQKTDGVYGISTARALNASVRYRKNKDKKR